ncbi:MAG: hypothetical protein Kow0077_06880 [Anaerolineae bacterium]
MVGSVTITRHRDFDDVFTEHVVVPDNLLPGLAWIQEHCPKDRPTTVNLQVLAASWQVPEPIVVIGLKNLSRTGFFTVNGLDEG